LPVSEPQRELAIEFFTIVYKKLAFSESPSYPCDQIIQEARLPADEFITDPSSLCQWDTAKLTDINRTH
jgi:hypothetical protein